jgi:hypothetical protein
VTEHADKLREAFETHENQTPDPAAVYARVQQLSQKYQRRRRTAVVAGSAFVGVGLIAGAAQIPAVLAGVGGGGGGSDIYVGVAPPAAVSASPSASEKDALEAYFTAGYDFEDAMRLAVLWNKKAEPYEIKAEAGRKLLAGETLPFPATPDEQVPPTPDPASEKAREAFFDAGYVWEDAVRLAQIWKLTDPGEAKVVAGKKLLAHEALPFKPKPGNVVDAKEAAQVEAFFEAGYPYEAAVKLAELWKLPSPYDAKVLAGKKLLAGETLPIEP